MTATKLPVPVVVGIAVRYQPVAKFGMYVHESFWTLEFDEQNSDSDREKDEQALHTAIVRHVQCFQRSGNYKGNPVFFTGLCLSMFCFPCIACNLRLSAVIIAGLATDGTPSANRDSPERLRKLARKLWFEVDVLPCIRHAEGLGLHDLACSVSRKALQHLEHSLLPGIVRVEVGCRHEVEVDANGRLEFADLADYRGFCRPETWAELLSTADRVNKCKKSIVFFNSTPRGGGVAIIRHSTIRLCRLLGINAHWCPNPDIFVVTKKKFHNVLQGVATDTWLAEEDERQYIEWCLQNVDRYWADPDGPVAGADVIVVDDPQSSGMIKRLKEVNRRAKFVYRSHIEVRSDLLRDSFTTQARTWKFLWQSIRLCDVFVSHPVESFIPDDVRESGMQILKMPAITDPTDGLNKPLDKYSLNYYHALFNRAALENGATKADFTRPYFVQISRFDPSKGIPDLVDAYVEFRRSPKTGRFETQQIPQLIITGHGSIDDPEGVSVHKEIMAHIKSIVASASAENAFCPSGAEARVSDSTVKVQDIVRDIHVVRLSPSDRTLNALLQTALAAFQLSHREGFEIKVTEALLKGVPVVAYAAGGIPLQIRHEIDGVLLPVADVRGVANAMWRLVLEPAYRAHLSKNARSQNREEFLTPCNVLKWCKVMLES
ncbi:MAG: hypothetical protein BJ554DRAFT_6032 [Olpidium bornovanus]|uniref:Glycosyl transferase family 1 domain-containing protein n=1 Tax=Olpidium bornovanus TaxID=278681 RepID=A0A8H7ZYF3_9FUNG|nr:MAG: hypothetical protein BJ554DRAFT_6032 [Olpidium bornovanus]